MNDLLALSLVALAAPAVLFIDTFAQWVMRLLLTETSRRPETVADLEGMAGAEKRQPEPELEHAQAA